jgi:hypothetical protein
MNLATADEGFWQHFLLAVQACSRSARNPAQPTFCELHLCITGYEPPTLYIRNLAA